MSTARTLRLAHIDPQRCIGCTRCIDACPFDAIIGAPQRMHTVVAASCIGCALCLPPCPVDCIALVEAQPPAPLTRAQAIEARARRERRRERLAREAAAPVELDRTERLAAALRHAQQRHAGAARTAGANER